MRTVFRLAVVPAVLAAVVAASALISSRAGAAVPSAIDGTYAGKTAFKFYPLNELAAAAKGSDTADMTVNFNEPNLMINMTVHADGGDQLYTLMGSFGQGRFHATGGGPGGQTTIAGKASGLDGKVKLTGSGFTLSPDSITELKFVFKELAPPE